MGFLNTLLATSTALMALSQTASADPDRLSALEARLAQLEAQKPATGTISVPSGVNLQFYGMVRADAYKDFDYALGNNSIGIGGVTSATPRNSGYGSHAYQTRFGLRGSVEDVKFNLETDFYGAGGGSMRIRHAYGEYAGFTIGQTWTNWGAYNASGMWDFDGLAGGPGYRTLQLRYTAKVSDALAASVSAEEDPLPWRNRPILTGALNYTAGANAYKATAMSRRIDDASGKSVSGWGASLSANLKPWEGGSVQMVAATGKGIASMLKGGTGVGRQADGTRSFYDIDANGNAIGVNAYSIGVSHALTSKVELGLAYGRNDYDNFAGATGGTIRSLAGTILTLKYRPNERVAMGLDYMTFERKERSGAKVKADRLLAAVQFSF